MKLNEIIEKCEKEEKQIFLRSNILNQAKGLTAFIELLEAKAKTNNINFDIVGGNPCNVIPYEEIKSGFKTVKIERYEEAKQVLLKSYVKFIYGDFIYYFSINENPYFNHHIGKNKINVIDGKKVYNSNYYLDDLHIFKTITIEELYSYNEEAKKILAYELLEEFEKAKECKNYYDKKRNSKRFTECEIKEELYYN